MTNVYTEGLNNFDIVYYINLKHRTDRLENITNELNKTNISKEKINRVEGIYFKTFGILGCAKSHIKTLELFLSTPPNIKNCIIFEDDFIFTKGQDEITNLINEFCNLNLNYNVLMLSSNILNSTDTPYPFLKKIIDAQTLSGYVVNKEFAPKLLANYKESVMLLERVGHKYHPFCFDIYMKKLQPISNWFCLNPRIGKQIKSYSDIENNIVDYDC